MKQRLRLLIVESSNADLASLLHALDSQGFHTTHTVVATPTDMRAALEAHEWDLIIGSQPIPGFPARCRASCNAMKKSSARSGVQNRYSLRRRCIIVWCGPISSLTATAVWRG